MTHLNLHDKYSYYDLALAYFDCRKHKRMTKSALEFELNFEDNLYCLLEEINSNSYKIGQTKAFVVTYPKAREVWAALFRDRIIHHLVCADIFPYFKNRFIEDSYACIKNRGTLAAVNRCEHFLRSITQNWSKPAYILQMDLKNFFVSIDKNILYNLIVKHIGTESLTSNLVKNIIYYDPTINPIVDKNSNFSLIPKHKSLWYCDKTKGLPIGNLTSQLFANIYLDELDKYIKHKLNAKYYVRYVDDFFILHTSKTKLEEYFILVDQFLNDNLLLNLNKKKSKIFNVYNGITFLGSTILPYRILPNKRVIAKFSDSIDILHKNYFDKHALASINSYLGLIQHQNSFILRKKLCELAKIPSILEYDTSYTKMFMV